MKYYQLSKSFYTIRNSDSWPFSVQGISKIQTQPSGIMFFKQLLLYFRCETTKSWIHCLTSFLWIFLNFSTKRHNKKEGKKYFYFREFFLFVCLLARSPIFNSTIVRTAKTQPYFIQTAAERKQPQFRNPFRNEIVSTFALSSWKMHICFFEKHLVWAEQNDKIISCAIFISFKFFC